MPKYDGSTAIEMNINHQKADRELTRLKRKINDLEDSISTQESKKAPLVEQANALRAKIKAATAEVDKYREAWKNGVLGADKDQSKAAETVQQLKTEYDAIIPKIEKIDEKLNVSYSRLERMKTAAGDLQRQMAAAGQGTHAGEYDDATPAAEKTGSIISRMKALFSEGAQSIKIGAKGIADGALSAFKKVGSGATTALKSVKGFITNGLKKLPGLIGKAAKGLSSLFTSTKKAGGGFSGGLKNLLMYGVGIRSLVTMFNKLRSAATEGMQNLAQFSTETNGSLSMLKSALTQLKNSLATAFAPILTTVAPILTRFINMLSSAADTVARFMAQITGKTSYTRAIAVQEDYASSLENTADAASDAADESSKFLASFDEINQIPDNSATGSSGGSGSGGVTPDQMFEEVAIEPLSFDSWGEAFYTMLNKLLDDGIPKLKSALSGLASWINTFSANLYEMFTFPGVYESVVLLGAEISGAFNDLVNQIDWGMMGSALGAGVNTALGFLVSLVYSFDWFNLGASIATFINNTVSQINWYNVGRLLWSKFKIAIETFTGFLANLDMVELAQAASNLVIGFFDSVSETIQGIDWAALAEQIVTFLVNVDWGGIFAAATEAAGSLAGGILSFVGQAVKDAFTGIYDYFAAEVEAAGGDIVSGIFLGIVDALENIDMWIYNNIFLPFINGFCDAFGIHSPSTVMQEQGGYIIAGLFEGLKGLWDKVKKPFIDLYNGVTGIVEDIKSWFRENLMQYFTADYWKQKFQTIWQAITSWWNTTVAPVFTVSFWKELGKSILNGLISAFENGLNAIISGVNRITSAISSALSFNIGGYSVGLSIPQISSVSIPRLAAGAVIPPNREFMAVLGDQTSGNNIEAPESLIRSIVREETGASYMPQVIALLNRLLEKDTDVVLDGKSLTKTVTKYQRQGLRATGG